jgi:hypothetical protein
MKSVGFINSPFLISRRLVCISVCDRNAQKLFWYVILDSAFWLLQAGASENEPAHFIICTVQRIFEREPEGWVAASG